MLIFQPYEHLTYRSGKALGAEKPEVQVLSRLLKCPCILTLLKDSSAIKGVPGA
jgi:hypothetical protein